MTRPPPAEPAPPPEPPVDRLPSMPKRTRVLIVLLAVATAGVVMWMVFDPQGRLARMNRPPADRPPCTAERTTDCSGGKVDVFVVPAAPAASTPR